MADNTVEVNLTEVNRTFAKLLRGLRDATPLAKLIGEDYTEAVDDRFRNEADPDGSPWAALDPKYVEWKKRKGFIPKRLQMRGDMRGTIAYQELPDQVVIGVNVPYAKKQNYYRPFLFRRDGSLGAKDVARLEAITNDYLQNLVNNK